MSSYLINLENYLSQVYVCAHVYKLGTKVLSYFTRRYGFNTTVVHVGFAVERPGREADNSAPSSAEVRNAWSYTSTPQYDFMAWSFVKHRDNFTFTFFTFMHNCNYIHTDATDGLQGPNF